jgi:hypothetical protein
MLMAEAEAPPNSDRRQGVRRVTCFPGYVDHEDDRLTSLISDLSEGGALLLVGEPDWGVGDEVRLELFVALDVKTPRIAFGRVVRIEPIPLDRASLWSHEVAVAFDPHIVLSAAELESLEKQAPFGNRR